MSLSTAIRVLTLCMSSYAMPALAMDFHRVQLPNGTAVLFGVGEITKGDVNNLLQGLVELPRDEYGTKTLALNSPGGLVAEAFAMANVINISGITTIIPPGAKCASACAVILFISGRFRVVLDGGQLGMHHCYRGAGILAPDCNEAISEHALRNGVSYGSIMAFMQYAMPNEMVWFGMKEADCFGLTRWPSHGPITKSEEPCVEAALTGAPWPLKKKQ